MLARSLSTRLTILFVLIGLIPALILNAIAYIYISDLEETTLQRDSAALNRTISRNIERFFTTRDEQVLAFAGDNSLTLPISILAVTEPNTSTWRTASNTLQTSINRIIRDFADLYVDIFVSSGETIVYNQQGVLFDEAIATNFIGDALTNAAVTWSPWIYIDSLETNVLYCAAPVLDLNDEAIGTVGLAVPISAINQVVHDFASPNDLVYNAYLIDPQGVLFSTVANYGAADPLQQVSVASVDDAAILSEYNDYTQVRPNRYQSFTGVDVVACTNLVDFGGQKVALVTETPYAAAFAGIRTLKMGSLLFIIATLALILSLSAIISRSITKPINELVSSSERAAQGDLSTQIESTRKDEIGKLIKAFNTMTKNLRDMIASINDTAKNASTASQELSAATEENSATIEEIVSTINEYAQTTKNLSKISQDMTREATNVEQYSLRGSNQMSNSNTAMLEILDTSRESQSQISQLEKSVEQISEVVNIISEIAEQTNLLALNAAIEAARAGTHGRSFAVVADEVRKLAEKTQESISIILGYINHLRTGTGQTVTVINNNNAKIEEGAEILRQTQTDFDKISTSIKLTTALINNVAVAGNELEIGMAELAASSEEQAASMGQIASNTNMVAKMAEEMTKLVKKFTL